MLLQKALEIWECTTAIRVSQALHIYFIGRLSAQSEPEKPGSHRNLFVQHNPKSGSPGLHLL